MCIPIAVAMAATAAVAATSAIIKGVSDNKQAQAQADFEHDQGVIGLQRAATEAGRVQTQASLAIGEGKARIAQSGVAADTGSPLEALTQVRFASKLDTDQIKTNAALSAWGHNTQADMYRAAGTNSLVQGGLGAGASFMSAAADYYKGKKAGAW